MHGERDSVAAALSASSAVPNAFPRIDGEAVITAARWAWSAALNAAAAVFPGDSSAEQASLDGQGASSLDPGFNLRIVLPHGWISSNGGSGASSIEPSGR
jgi:hypothetical protein